MRGKPVQENKPWLERMRENRTRRDEPGIQYRKGIFSQKV